MVTDKDALREVARDVADNEAIGYSEWPNGTLLADLQKTLDGIHIDLLNGLTARASEKAAYFAGMALELTARLRPSR